MTKNTHAAAITASDLANTEADEHFKAGRFEQAVRLLKDFLAEWHDDLPAGELLRTLANLGAFELGRGNLHRALELHQKAAALADACCHTDPELCGRFYNNLGAVYLRLVPEDPENEDRAIECFTAASHYHQEAGQYRQQAEVENDLACLHAEAGRVARALDHVARAWGCRNDDQAVLAQVEDTQALIALAAGDARPVLEFSNASVSRLLRLDEPRLLAASVRTLVRAGRAFLRIEEEASIRVVLADCGWNLTRAAAVLGFNSREAFKLHLKRNFPRLDDERRNRSVPVKPDE